MKSLIQKLEDKLALQDQALRRSDEKIYKTEQDLNLLRKD